MVEYTGIHEPKGMSSKETMFSAFQCHLLAANPIKFNMWFFSLKPIAILRSHHQKHAVLKGDINDIK
jgi:hypothetical protein